MAREGRQSNIGRIKYKGIDMEALNQHEHPVQHLVGIGKAALHQLKGGAWAELPRPVPVAEVLPLPTLPNLTDMYREAA